MIDSKDQHAVREFINLMRRDRRLAVRLESETVSILGARGTKLTTMRRRDGGRYVKREMDAAEFYREILAQLNSAKVVRV